MRVRFQASVLALFVAAWAGAAVRGDVVYVRASATGTSDGSSWQDAFTSFDDALGAARPGDEIWTALGVYSVPTSFGFLAPDGVSLYGGFVGIESSTSERLATNRSHLTGFHPFRANIVLTLMNPTPGTVIDGFLFDGTLTLDHNGGGLAVHGGVITVHNCLFFDNIAGSGAGVYLSNTNATFTDCEFDNNFCQVGDGGGIEAVGSGSLTVTRCFFHDNLARELYGVVGRGGGIFADAGVVLHVSDSRFERNRAYNLGLQFVATGGGIANRSPNARIENCTFIRNDATLGGAISSDVPLTIVNCVMTGNRAVEPPVATPFESGQGGAVYGPEGVSISIKNCTIAANWSKHTAAGLWMDGLVENTILYSNVSLVEPGDNPEPLADQQSQGEIVFRYSNVEGLSTPDSQHPGTISTSPQFLALPVLTSPTGFYPLYAPGDVRVSVTSPCLDAGDNAVLTSEPPLDVAGVPRFLDAYTILDTGVGSAPVVDMGAYEFAEDCDGDDIPEYVEFINGTIADCNGSGIPDACEIAMGASLDIDDDLVPDECEVTFRRGDCNGLGGIDVADVIYLLSFLFTYAAAPGCIDACDVNDDGHLNLADCVYLLVALFEEGAPPAAPYPDCGADAAGDALSCANFASCP
ncbi:MAG: right-handed parallel beta-helix repeat-containing protein [Planctomycetota bacterium]